MLMLSAWWPRRPGKTRDAVTKWEFGPSLQDGCGSGSFPGGMTEGDATETGEGGTGTKTCPGDSRGVQTGFGMKSVTSLERVEDVIGRAGWRWRAKGSQRPPWSSGKRLATHLDEEETADLKGRRGQGLRVGSPARGLATQSRRSSKGSEGSVKGQRPAPRCQLSRGREPTLRRVLRTPGPWRGWPGRETAAWAFLPVPHSFCMGPFAAPAVGSVSSFIEQEQCTCHVEMVRGVQKCSFLSQDGGKRF